MTTAPTGPRAVPQTAVEVADLPLTVLEPVGKRPTLGLRELWERRELTVFLAQRDVTLRYRQTFLGVAWALLQPLVTMAIFTVVFGRLGRIDSDGAPYALFALAGLVPWSVFSSGLSTVALSLVTNASLVSKVYFPRLAVPVGAALAGLVDLAVGIGLLVPVALVAGTGSPLRLLVLPPLAVLGLLAVLGPGLFLATVNVRYRDVRYVLPFLVQTLLFVSPVVYSTNAVDPAVRLLYALNPMVAVIEGFRWAVVGTPGPSAGVVLVSVGSALLLALVGLRHFRAQEATFADVL